MNEPTVSDERVAEIERLSAKEPHDRKAYKTLNAFHAAVGEFWLSFGGQVDGDDIAAICRELLTRREADRLTEKGTTDADE